MKWPAAFVTVALIAFVGWLIWLVGPSSFFGGLIVLIVFVMIFG